MNHSQKLAIEQISQACRFGYNTVIALTVAGSAAEEAISALAQTLGRDVYRVDLNRILSKYIGETEKNLKGIFTEAKRRKSILVFDEADTLFGKRSDVKDSHDRFANMETNYLLQRIEEYGGIVILVTNSAGEIDAAFRRRCHVI